MRSHEELVEQALAGDGPFEMTWDEWIHSLSRRDWYQWWNWKLSDASTSRREFCGRPVTRVRELSESPTTEQMIRELLAAGWIPVRTTLWRDPRSGHHHLGPYGAWLTATGRRKTSSV